MKKNALSAFAITVLLLGASSIATAGNQVAIGVSINDANSYAQGSIADARESADDEQQISCSLEGNGYGSCLAINAVGTVRSCVTNTPAMVAAIASIGPDASILFRWDSEGFCTRVRVTNGSQFRN